MQRGALGVDALAVVGVAPTTELIEEPAVDGEVVKVARAAQQQGVLERPLEMAMWPFDRAVLMRDATVVAARRHGVMRAQGFVADRPIGGGVALEVTESCGQAVAAMLPGGAAERPEGILQALGQRHETLAAEHRMDMFEAAVGQTEVIEPVDQRRARDANAEVGHVSEVRQAHPARFVNLAEDHLAVRAVQRAPVAHATLQGPPDSLAKLGMTAQNLAEDRHRPQARCGFQHRNDLGIEDPGQRIGPSPIPRGALERGGSWILLQPIPCGGAKTSLGGGDRHRVRRSILHEKPHLMIGCMTAGHGCSLFEEKSPTYPSRLRSPDGAVPPEPLPS